MSGTKPTMLWHADGEGKCHRGCEQWNEEHGYSGCKLLDLLAWEVFQRPTIGDVGCPFAVLADVLALHERQPAEDRRCGTCAEWSSERESCQEERVGEGTSLDGPPWPNCRFWRQR